MNDKNQLLQDYDTEQKREKNIDFKTLLLVYLALGVAFLIILPKVYIKNQIYYISRDINKLDTEYSILEEENRYLKQKVESIKFKNQILDSVLIDLGDNK
jgi:cell division protein FtsL